MYLGLVWVAYDIGLFSWKFGFWVCVRALAFCGLVGVCLFGGFVCWDCKFVGLRGLRGFVGGVMIFGMVVWFGCLTVLCLLIWLCC